MALSTLRFPFSPRKGGPATATQNSPAMGPFDDASAVRAGAVVQGFDVQYDKGHHVQQVTVDVATGLPIAAADGTVTVPVTVTFGMRDSDSNYDDEYSGFVNVLVLAEQAVPR